MSSIPRQKLVGAIWTATHDWSTTAPRRDLVDKNRNKISSRRRDLKGRMNRRLSKVLVLPGTTNLRGWPDEVVLERGVLKEATAFCCREVTPIAIADLTKRAGVVSNSWLELACETLATVFDCSNSSD